MTPTRLRSRVVLLEQIGSGGMGAVWRAWDRETRQYVAAKVVGSAGPGWRRRAVREQAMRVAHPHVLAPTACLPHGAELMILMPLVAGGSLAELGERQPRLPPGWVTVLLDQLLTGLDALHGAGVVHRDVKPANLLLEPTDTGPSHLRLADFGVAAVIGDERLTQGGGVGTPGYAAPEQLHGADPDPRQDLYSVGVIARELLPPRTPLAALIAELSDPDPDQRLASAAVALRRLRRTGAPAGAPTGAAADLEPATPRILARWPVESPPRVRWRSRISRGGPAG